MFRPGNRWIEILTNLKFRRRQIVGSGCQTGGQIGTDDDEEHENAEDDEDEDDEESENAEDDHEYE